MEDELNLKLKKYLFFISIKISGKPLLGLAQLSKILYLQCEYKATQASLWPQCGIQNMSSTCLFFYICHHIVLTCIVKVSRFFRFTLSLQHPFLQQIFNNIVQDRVGSGGLMCETLCCKVLGVVQRRGMQQQCTLQREMQKQWTLHMHGDRR